MSTPIVIALGALCVAGSAVAYCALILRALVAADKAREADPNYAADWDEHVNGALYVASPIPDTVPAEWSQQ